MNWTGKDTWGGLAPSQARKDLPRPPRWRMEAVAAAERPHHLVLADDGSVAAFLLDRADLGTNIWVLRCDGSPPSQLTVDRQPAPFWEDSSPAWDKDGKQVAYTAGGWVKLIDSGGGPSRRLVEGGEPVWLPDGRLLVSVEQDRETARAVHPRCARVSRLALVDPNDPWPMPITPPFADFSSAAVSPDGSQIAAVAYPPDDRNRSDVVVIGVESGEARILVGIPKMHASFPVWSPDGKTLAVVCEEPGWYEVFLAEEGELWRPLTSEAAAFSHLHWSTDGTRLLATRTRSARTDLVAIDVSTGRVDMLAAGGVWSDPWWLPDGSVLAIYEDHGHPPRIEQIMASGERRVLFDPTSLSVRAAPHVSPIDINFRGSDGLEIQGFLFRPAAADRGKVPAVVYPHGGPTSHYADEWDGYAQYFLDKGYAWLAVNFRGSTSFGREFERTNHGAWGVADTGDCLAATDFLAGIDWIDVSRLAIFGASYGAYLAICALAGDPQHRFACGVAKYGDSDILTGWAQADRPGFEDVERMMGHPADNPLNYLEGSPIHRVKRIERPLLIAHGEKDERVHPLQSEELVAALALHRKTYEYVTYPTEGHGLLRMEPQLHFYRRLERFLDWYLM